MTPQQVRRARALRAQGYSLRAVAEKVGVPFGTIASLARREKWPTPEFTRTASGRSMHTASAAAQHAEERLREALDDLVALGRIGRGQAVSVILDLGLGGEDGFDLDEPDPSMLGCFPPDDAQ